ncbi:dihydropyrimidinase [Pseudoroseicyclus sp. CXY001]|uniref:dihydropyrimidinase n=1 Tax=Pseudoroseicyclus sp. CXY001 TaxID=3242492 RepID=UPI003570D28B
MTYDLLIRGGTVVTSREVLSVDIAVSGGRIAALGHDLGPATREIDATGKIVVPGGIDSHVHIAQPQGGGVVMADGFDSATRSAICGGTTTVLPFCLQEDDRTMREVLTEYHAKAEGQSWCDVSFHLIVTDPTPSLLGQELPALIEDGYTSFKVFMTYEGLRLDDHEILLTMDCAREHGALVMVHCENEDAIRFLVDKHLARGDVAPKFHATTRPVPVEREATNRALSLSEIVDTPVVIVHVSNGAAIDEIRRARGWGVKVTAETCPQYLVLTEDDLDREGWEGAKYVCSPPPRDRQAQADCWAAIQDGTFDLFSSDHCPFVFESDTGKKTPDGLKSFRRIPNGIPGIETRLPILFSEGVRTGRIGLTEFVRLGATNHAKSYGLYPQKGEIAVGSDADIAIWDPSLTRPITQDRLHHGSDYTPFEGIEITGWPVMTILGGAVIVEDGEPVGDVPRGRYLKRDRSPLVADAS